MPPPTSRICTRSSSARASRLQLLWEEYAAAHAGQAYRYSQFCWHYHRFAQSLKRSMRQVHRAGDKLFIDYSGDTVPIIDAGTGEIRRAEIFVAVLGASSLHLRRGDLEPATAGLDRLARPLLRVHGVRRRLCSSRTISRAPSSSPAATSRKRPRPTTIWPAITPRQFFPHGRFIPGTKPAVEASVLLVQRWILARLRHRQFFSLEASTRPLATCSSI